MGPDNNPATVRRYIPFGDGPTNEMPDEMAGEFMFICKRDFPLVFAVILARVHGIELPMPRQRANGKR